LLLDYVVVDRALLGRPPLGGVSASEFQKHIALLDTDLCSRMPEASKPVVREVSVALSLHGVHSLHLLARMNVEELVAGIKNGKCGCNA